MTQQLPEAKFAAPQKRIWRPWKWIGLAVFGLALLFGTWLPSAIVLLGYAYGILVIANVLVMLSIRLKNRMFWRVRNRLVGSFVFVGVISLALLAGILALSGYIFMGQLASRYLENSLDDVRHQLEVVNGELAGKIPADVSREAVYRSVIDKIRAWQGDLPQHDDITLIIAQTGL
jgi:hypothetical protein